MDKNINRQTRKEKPKNKNYGKLTDVPSTALDKDQLNQSLVP